MKSRRGGWVRCGYKLTGKTVLITGANTGIGLETAIDLASREARVIIACRDIEKALNARERIIKESGSLNVEVKELDLSSLESVRRLAEDVNRTEERLDILINNAGVMVCPQWETKEGFEMQFGVNHLGHFLLTNLLLDLIKKSAPSRIITVSSIAHSSGKMNWKDLNLKKDYNPTNAYCQSKLMNVLFSRELSRRLEGSGVTSNSLHPGFVATELGRHVGEMPCSCMSCLFNCVLKMNYIKKTPEHGAQTSIYCAVAPELEKVSGKYFKDCKITSESRRAKNDEDAAKLWNISEEFVHLK